MPIDPKEIKWDKPEGSSPSAKPPKNIQWDSDPWYHTDGMKKMLGNAARTAELMGKVYPGLETAANVITSAYGVPISGLVGIASLPFGLDTANNAIEAVQKYLVYTPNTAEGQELTNTAMWPIEKVEQGAKYVGGKIAETGRPNLAAAVDTAITASPALLGAKGYKPTKAAKKMSRTIDKGINKAVRPSVVKKEMYSQQQKYMKNARTAVDEIIRNKNDLVLMDKDGNPYTGLPRTLSEFSQAIEQTKHNIFRQYDDLARSADASGAKVQMGPVAMELDGVINNRVMQTMSPDTIQYAKARQKALAGKEFTAVETQQMIQILNQSNEAFYKNPTPDLKGRAYVDSMIANNLRAGLDAVIERTTGIEYQPLKRRYGALRMLETDVTKRSIVDARKNIKGLIDFSDVFSSHQLVYGMFSGQGASMAAGITTKGVSSWIKWINDPNRIVKNTFKKSAKLRSKAKGRPSAVSTSLMAGGAMAGLED